jgi:hypothetical protein
VYFPPESIYGTPSPRVDLVDVTYLSYWCLEESMVPLILLVYLFLQLQDLPKINPHKTYPTSSIVGC